MQQPKVVIATLLALALIPAVGEEPSAQIDNKEPSLQTAIFAGGCFWCMEKPFDELDGVHGTEAGYIGGHKRNPTYRQVSSGKTGHTEAVKVTFDPGVVSYRQLLEVFWRNIDPLNAEGQFCDLGSQYRSGIFYTSADQQQAAENSLQVLQDNYFGEQTIVTEITNAARFYPAEDYHQNYYKKNPLRYRYYRHSCGRDRRLEEVWGDYTG